MSKGSGSTRSSSSSAPRGLSAPASSGVVGISKANIQLLYNANYLDNKSNPTDADIKTIVNTIEEDYGKYIASGFDDFYEYNGKELSEAIFSAIVGKNVKIERSAYSTDIKIDDNSFISMREGTYGKQISYFHRPTGRNTYQPGRRVYNEKEFNTWKEIGDYFKKR